MFCLKNLTCWILILSGIPSYAQEVVINEMMSTGQSFLFDEDGDGGDWIELYNTTTDTVHLSEYYLSDDQDNLLRWRFPEVSIAPGAFLLVHASGKNRRVAGNELHTNFSIQVNGEDLFLSHNSTIVHRMPPVSLTSDLSYGLAPDGGASFVTFSAPTPGYSNGSPAEGSDGILFSVPGGIYDTTLQVQMLLQDNNTIYYTLDGTLPTIHSIRYNGELLTLNNTMCSGANIHQQHISPPHHEQPPAVAVPKGIVIRAAAFDENGQSGKVISHSYFIKDLGIDHGELPIVSVNTEHADLFDHERGIFVAGIHWNENDPDWSGNYYQRGDEWERRVHVAYYEPGTNNGFSQDCGLRTHGGNSRRFPQKALRLYARDEYGSSRFEYPVFPDKPLDSYKRLVLKPFSSSWSQAGIEDFVANKIVLNTRADGISTRPAVLYINGEYWGIYYLQERIDDHYLEANFGVSDRGNVDIIENWWGEIVEGTNEDFLNLYRFIEQHDLSAGRNYEAVAERIDIDNFIDYQLFEIFIANYDWPANNMKCWRDRGAATKWRWIFSDGDGGLQNYEFNGFSHALNTTGEGWPTNPQATLFLRKLLGNEGFQVKFFARLEHLLNNTLSYDSTSSAYYSSIAHISHEITNQLNRFGNTASQSTWAMKADSVNLFLENRTCTMIRHCREMFGKNILSPSCNEDPEVNNISIIPNPNNGNNYKVLFLSGGRTIGKVIVTNILGQLVCEKDCLIMEGNNSLDFENLNLPRGVFIVSLTTKKGTTTGGRMIVLQ